MARYKSQYPPSFDSTYIKATTEFSVSYPTYATASPYSDLTGGSDYNQWYSGSGEDTNQRFHIDLGLAKAIKRIYYENSHTDGIKTGRGAKNIIVQGSNEASAFANLEYLTDDDWTDIATYADQDLTVVKTLFDEHVGLDQPDPKYLYLDNDVKYRYYAIKIADNYGETFMGIRRVELQKRQPRRPGIIYY